MLTKNIHLILILLTVAASGTASFQAALADTYVYDDHSRIIRADYRTGFTESFTYDDSGNRLSVSVTSRWISGSGLTSTNEGSTAEISVEIRASSPEEGALTYKETGSNITISSKSVDSLIMEDETAVIIGYCTMNGLYGYYYTAIFTDSEPDTIEIEIYTPDGTLYYSTGNKTLLSGNLSIETEPFKQYLLTTSVSPPDSGKLRPDCSGGCIYEKDTVLTISANRNSDYVFADWSGCSTAEGSICTVTMSGDQAVEAYFSPCSGMVRLKGTDTEHFTSLQNAYNASSDGDNIELRAGTLPGDIMMDRDIEVTVNGGHDCTYRSSNGTTSIEGSLRINSGTVTIGGIALE